MSEEGPEWIVCIAMRLPKYVTWCGRYLFDFLFQSLEHALMAEERGSRLVPCSDCVRNATAERERTK